MKSIVLLCYCVRNRDYCCVLCDVARDLLLTWYIVYRQILANPYLGLEIRPPVSVFNGLLMHDSVSFAQQLSCKDIFFITTVILILHFNLSIFIGFYGKLIELS